MEKKKRAIGITIVKLGGSLITNKDKPLSPNLGAMRSVGRAIETALEDRPALNLFLVHGGGSFGHYYASKYGVTTSSTRVQKEGITKVAQAMISLHSMILDELIQAGISCRTIAPGEFLSCADGPVSPHGSEKISALMRIGCIPVSFGDIMTTDRGTSIMSGDSIILSLAQSFDVARVIFAMDVDGIFPDREMPGSIINELTPSGKVLSRKHKFDVTGGIYSKIKVGFQLSKLGAEVFFVNGTKRERLEKLIIGKKATSTHIASNSIST